MVECPGPWLPEVKPMSKWIVGVKGSPNTACFEIAVLRSENAHGSISYGWFDKNKLLITHNGGPCHWSVTKKVWDKLLIVAQEVADELNAEEMV